MLAGLEWADDAGWYIGHALDNGFKPKSDELIDILKYWASACEERLLESCFGPFTQAQVIEIVNLIDEASAASFATKSRSFGAEFDDAGIVEMAQTLSDAELIDLLVLARIVNQGPYKPWEFNTPDGTLTPVEFCTHLMFEGAVVDMDGRFTYEQAMDFVIYCICKDYTDDTLEVILSATDCGRGQADELLFGNGYSRRPDPILQPDAPAKPRKVGLFEAIGAAFVGKVAWDAFSGDGKAAPTTGEPAFQDFNNARGSNNDHNWEADGDMRWDDYSGM